MSEQFEQLKQHVQADEKKTTVVRAFHISQKMFY
jgi:hypothetical protein